MEIIKQQRCLSDKVLSRKVLYLKEKGKITNSEYQVVNAISDKTSSRELENLKQAGVLKKVDDKEGAYYEFKKILYGGYLADIFQICFHKEYQEINNVSKSTATNDFLDLVKPS